MIPTDPAFSISYSKRKARVGRICGVGELREEQDEKMEIKKIQAPRRWIARKSNAARVNQPDGPARRLVTVLILFEPRHLDGFQFAFGRL